MNSKSFSIVSLQQASDSCMEINSWTRLKSFWYEITCSICRQLLLIAQIPQQGVRISVLNFIKWQYLSAFLHKYYLVQLASTCFPKCGKYN